MKKTMVAMAAVWLLACGQVAQVQSATPPAQHDGVAKEAEFEFGPEQFAHAFNAASKSFGQSFRIHKVDVRHGNVHDYFQQPLSGGVSLTVGVSKETGRVLSVTALIEGDNKSPHGTHALLAIAEVVAAATNPHLTKAKASALAADMLKEADNHHEAGQFPQRFLNHVRYVLRSDSGIGYWWIANPV